MAIPIHAMTLGDMKAEREKLEKIGFDNLMPSQVERLAALRAEIARLLSLLSKVP